MIYSAQRPFVEMLTELGITTHPSPVEYHRELRGPNGESLGLWEANNRLAEVLQMPNPLAEFQKYQASRK